MEKGIQALVVQEVFEQVDEECFDSMIVEKYVADPFLYLKF